MDDLCRAVVRRHQPGGLVQLKEVLVPLYIIPFFSPLFVQIVKLATQGLTINQKSCHKPIFRVTYPITNLKYYFHLFGFEFFSYKKSLHNNYLNISRVSI